MSSSSPQCAPVVYNGSHYVANFKASATLTVGSAPTQLAADYLVVGGGGAGGYDVGGGGGSGGYRTSFPGGTKTNLNTGVTHIIVGTGASANGPSQQSNPAGVLIGNSGTKSEFNQIISCGGGSGGAKVTSAPNSIYVYAGRGIPGGSGGGGGGQPTTSGTAVGGDAINGQGFSGGKGNYICSGGGALSPYVPGVYLGGGGGGAGAVGFWGSLTPVGGTGGAGLANSITGAAVTYAGGGGGGPGGAGGPGGGGCGASGVGSANTGGGGAAGSASCVSGAGGSGVVVIRTPGPSGPTISVAPGTNTKATSPGPDGSMTISTFKVTGTLTIS